MNNLSALQPGDWGIILGVEDELLGLKLMEMGFIPGEKIQCKFTAPSGDPVAYATGANTIALRKTEAEKVKIKLWQDPK